MGYRALSAASVRSSGATSVLVLVLAMSLGVVLGPACLRVKDDACLVSGGDQACGLAEICIVPTKSGGDPSLASDRGCQVIDGGEPRPALRLNQAPDGYVRAPFGVPLRLEATAAGDLESVEGVIDAAWKERGLAACEVDLEELRPAWTALFDEVRAPLERRARVRTAAMALDGARAKVLEDFNLAMLDQIVECEKALPGTGTDGTSDDTGDTDSATGSGTDDSTTGPQPCIQDADCGRDPAKPYCDPVEGICAACDRALDDATADAACATLDPSVPLCVNGDCVACTSENTSVCDEQLLLCDETAMACVPCAEHDECESGACDLLADEASCFEPENVFDVGAGQPYTTIAAALTDVEMMALDRAILRLHGQGTMADFDESATIDSGAVAFIAADGDQPQWSRSGAMAPPILAVTGSETRVYLDGVHLFGSESSISPGLMCMGASIDIRRSRIVANTGGGIRATDGCVIDIYTSFVGGDVNDADAIYIEDSALTMLYTTAGAGFGNARVLACNNLSSVTVRNSIMVSRDGGEIDCSVATLDSNATNVINGGTNVSVGAWNLNWFQDYAAGNFLLQTGISTNDGETVFADIAVWQAGDPITDIEGDPRPNADGTSDYPGADLVP